MSWNSFKDLAQTKVKQQPVYQQAQNSLIITEANKLIVELFPESKNKAQAVYLKDKTLAIAVLTDDLAINLINKKREFLQSLNKKFDSTVVDDWQILT